MKTWTVDMKIRRFVILVLVSTVLGLIPVAAQVAVPTPVGNLEILAAYQNAFRNVAEFVRPVVVRIDVVALVDRPGSAASRVPALGSGVLVQRDGDTVYVLTNEHVVGNAEVITVSLNDGREFDAQLVGTDADRDLAVVRIETDENVPLATLGDSDSLYVGDWAFAVGSPLGYESTVTAGIISAVGRQQPPGSGFSGFTDYIQTDAAINSGNSGGALVNLAGEVIGINTWIASRTGGSIGLGFAIPINNAKRVINELIASGQVENGWLGIVFGGQLSPELAESLRVGSASGALVGSVFAGSPADRAGILPGDVITTIGDDSVRDWTDLRRIVANVPAGQILSFGVLRENNRLDLPVRLVRRDENTGTSATWPGLAVVPLTDEVREGLSLRNESGTVVVAAIDAASPAAAAGLRRGDIIRRIGNERVDDVAEFYSIINAGDNDETLALSVGRAGRELPIDIVR